MHKTTIMISPEQRDFIEQFCFEHGLSFAAWVRQRIAEQRRQEQARQAGQYSGTASPNRAPEILGRFTSLPPSQ